MEIEQKRSKLNNVVNSKATKLLDQDVYKLSVELDFLIVQFMKIEQSKIIKGKQDEIAK